MQFENGHIYHIFNQGINGQRIFFNRDNYFFFLRKIKINILPYADILCWCLMPNHFHLMVLVYESELVIDYPKTCDYRKNNKRSLNNSIAIMLRSYTRAIQNQGLVVGNLFRQKTKAECITYSDGVTPSFFSTKSGVQINIIEPEKLYPEVCFHYIHQNPVKAGLVQNDVDWEFSSARDYSNLRNGTLINKELARKFIINF